jgi:transposase
MASHLERAEKIVKQEDPQVVAGLLASMMDHIESQKNLIAQLEAEQAKKSQESFLIEERIKLLRRSLYGRSKEDRALAGDRPRDRSQEEALIFSKAVFPAPETRNENQKGKARGFNLAEVVIEQRPTETELVSEGHSRGVESSSASQWMDTGLYDESFKIQIIERRYVKEIYRKYKSKLKDEFNPDPEKDVLITANGGSELLPGMNYTTEFVASVVADKYISHMPLERQTREMESLDLKGMKTSTLSRMAALAAASLEPMQEEILREDLLKSDLGLHLDETPWKIQAKQEKDGFMWVISNRYGSYYFFKPTRSGQVLREKLNGYTGPALTDGFGGYNVLAELGVQQGFCWAHARREFLPLESHDPTIKPILDLIDELFAIEREAKTFDELTELRQRKSKPVAEKLKTVLYDELPRSRPGSQKRKAIEYSLKRWDGLTLFLSEVKLPLSNNEAERTIRHAVMGRKNYYGSGNHVGAETAATLFTIIESAKKNDLDPRSFLLMSLQRAARGKKLETPLAYAKRTRSPNQDA